MRRFLLAVSVACGACAAIAACGGDDVVGDAVDAGHGDATQALDADVSRDASDHDASADATADAATDAPPAACTVIDGSTIDAALVQAGYQLMQTLDCQHCHGQLLDGNEAGVASPFGLAYPPNLTPDPATGLGCWSDAEIARAILHGVDDEGRTLCPPMPRFADAGVDEAGAAALVAFLRTIPSAQNQVPATMCAADAGDAGD